MVDYLEMKNIPIRELPQFEDIPDYLEEAKALVRKDRALLIKATQSFASYINAYKEHRSHYIFNIKELNMVSLLRSFLQFRVPTMKEMKWFDVSEFEEEDASNIPFKDKQREQNRLNKAANDEKKRRKYILLSPTNIRKEAKDAKKKALIEQQRQKLAAKKKALAAFDDDDFSNEYKLMKKYKKGKISKQY